MSDVPLDWKNEIIVPYFLEVALLPLAAVNKRNLILSKVRQWIGFREIRQNRAGVLFRVDHDVCHSGLLPSLIDLRMTPLTSLGAHIVGRRLRLTVHSTALQGYSYETRPKHKKIKLFHNMPEANLRFGIGYPGSAAQRGLPKEKSHPTVSMGIIGTSGCSHWELRIPLASLCLEPRVNYYCGH